MARASTHEAEPTVTLSVTATDVGGSVGDFRRHLPRRGRQRHDADHHRHTTANTLNGTAGDDVIAGLGGNDNLNGNAGNDMLDGGTGNDIMHGGTGNDIYIVDDVRRPPTRERERRSGQRHGQDRRGQLYAGRQCREPDLHRHRRFTGTGNTLNNTIVGGTATTRSPAEPATTC